MLRIATRHSELAQWQARSIQSLIAKQCGTQSELVFISTRGDQDQNTPFSALDGRGFFTRELENALLDGRADLAVHSLKDLPTTSVPGLELAAVLSRADRRDVLLARPDASGDRTPLPLKVGARLGTSSVRRRAQAALLAPDLDILELRGNVPTRVQKLRSGQYDAILLAKAGLDRLEMDLTDLDLTVLPVEVFLPAPGQGALAVEIRSDDEATRRIVRALDDERVRAEIEAERGLLNRFAGGCNLPLGAYAELAGEVKLSACYATCDQAGQWHAFHATRSGATSDRAAEVVFAELLALKTSWAREHHPLLGRTVAVTRPASAVNGLKEKIEELGATLLPLPTLAFKALPEPEPVDPAQLSKDYDWLLFTSQNAVYFFLQVCPERPELVKVGALGAATSAALEGAGSTVDLVGSGEGGGEFAVQFLQVVGPGRRVLWPTGESRRTELPDTLIAAGVTVKPLLLYRATLPPAEFRVPREQVHPDWILITSPEAGRNFVKLYGRPEGARWAAIGHTTQAAMQKLLGIPVTVAREVSLEALAEVLV